MVASCRTIGPRQLEKHLGDVAAMFLFRRNRENRTYTRGEIGIDSEGDYCLKSDKYGEKISLEHGDILRIRTKGRGQNSIRDYVYIDESD